MRLHVVDGTYELYRAHFSPGPEHVTSQGLDRKATVGVARSMLALLQDEQEAVTHIAVAFDNPIRSFRNRLFADYKSDDGVPPVLREQFDEVEAAVRALGIVVWSMDEWEADDALATAARKYVDEVDEVRIMSPDKDLLQCVADPRVVCVDRMRKRELCRDAAFDKFGVEPHLVPDMLALTGDSADGIPGIPGLGIKGAAAALQAFGSLEAIASDPAAWPKSIRGAARLCAALAERRDDAFLYKQLATLVTDVPLRESLAELEWKGVPRAEFEAWCDTYEVGSFRDRPKRWQ